MARKRSRSPSPRRRRDEIEPSGSRSRRDRSPRRDDRRSLRSGDRERDSKRRRSRSPPSRSTRYGSSDRSRRREPPEGRDYERDHLGRRLDYDDKYSRDRQLRDDPEYKASEAKAIKQRETILDRKRIAEEFEEGSTEYEMATMGLPTKFDTTKGKFVPGNTKGFAKVRSDRSYRQYMNRKAGFNRELSPERKLNIKK